MIDREETQNTICKVIYGIYLPDTYGTKRFYQHIFSPGNGYESVCNNFHVIGDDCFFGIQLMSEDFGESVRVLDELRGMLEESESYFRALREWLLTHPIVRHNSRLSNYLREVEPTVNLLAFYSNQSSENHGSS